MNTRSADRSAPPKKRQWAKGDRAKVSILHVFRAAHQAGDTRKTNAASSDEGAIVSGRSKERRHGISEALLREHLQADLNGLLNTIRLDAVVPLEDAPHVAKSVVNFGFRDLSAVSAKDLGSAQVVNSIRDSLLQHEPRLIPETVDVTIHERDGDSDQRLAVRVTAELMGDPVEIPVDFDAEVDLGAGRLRMQELTLNR